MFIVDKTQCAWAHFRPAPGQKDKVAEAISSGLRQWASSLGYSEESPTTGFSALKSASFYERRSLFNCSDEFGAPSRSLNLYGVSAWSFTGHSQPFSKLTTSASEPIIGAKSGRASAVEQCIARRRRSGDLRSAATCFRKTRWPNPHR